MRSLLLLVAWLFGSTAAAAEGLSPDKWFYEIDGDYGSEIGDFDTDNGGHNQDADEIRDGDVTTWGNRDFVACTKWDHTTSAPYMGQRAYTVGCIQSPDNARSEQHFLQGWGVSEDSARYVSMAIRLNGVPALPTNAEEDGGWIAQLHGEGLPFNLVWRGHPVRMPDQRITRPGYYLYAGAKYDEQQPDGTFETRQPYRLVGRLLPDKWTRVMIQIDISKGTGKCPNAISNAAFWTVSLMDNATGQWGEPVRYDGQMGNAFFEQEEPPLESIRCDGLKYNLKIGPYGAETTHRLDFDNISYGKRWSNITKNRLIGYKKSVLRLSFEETLSQTVFRQVEDRSYTWNGGNEGDPVSDYDNDGVIFGGVTHIDEGVKGRALHFPGTTGSYVKVPINADVVDDFDVGNYMTVSAWFRTDAKPRENKGLVMIDEFSDSWKLLVYMRRDGIAFGVRHPGAYSRLDHTFTRDRYADNEWHLVTGTYNRFAPDGRRIKLYIDGEKVMEGAGNDLPILRGENQLVVGKYSVEGFFQGDIDDVGLFNYTMTDAEVKGIWRSRLELGLP